MKLRRLHLLIPLFALLAACPANDPSNGVQTLVPPDQFLDYNGFVCDVQPVLIRRCSYLGCHGQASHALRVFSVGKLRKAGIGSKADRDAPLTADEVELNFESAAGVVYATSANDRDPSQPAVTRNPLLYKPLAARFGGGEHHGVAVFPQFGYAQATDDPDFLSLVRWSAGQKQPWPPTQACRTLFDALGLDPRSP